MNFMSSEMNKLIFLTYLFLRTSCSFAQGVGSMEDDYSDIADKRLVSLEFNGRLYAPRHGNLPLENYKAKFLTCDRRFTIPYTFRPIELLVSEDEGKTWSKAYMTTIFESVHSKSLHVELMVHNEIAKMCRIDDTHFALATEFRMSVNGGTKTYYYPIIYIFTENIREGYYNIEEVAQFQPEAINDNSITEIKTEGNKTIFTLKTNGTVTFTLNPSPTEKYSFEDSFGNFQKGSK